MKKREHEITMLSVSSMIYDARIQREAKALRDAGYHVTILYIEDQEFFYSLPDPEGAWESYKEHMSGIVTKRYFLRSRRWRFLPTPINKGFQALELAYKFTSGVLKYGGDFYHVHDLTPAIFGLLGKWFKGAKLVYDAHELEVEVVAASATTKKMKRWYEQLTVRNAALSITVNDYIAEVMQSAYGKPVAVVSNKPKYVSEDQLSKNALREVARLTCEQKIVLYVGYLNLARGIDKVVEALKFLDDDIVFLLMGTGRIEEHKGLLYSLADEIGVNRTRIKFVGPFPPEDVITYLSGADVSVMLYQSNTSNAVINAPNKLFQSIMARVPVVASHNKSFPIFINENGHGPIGITVDETNPKAIAAGIMEALDEKNQVLYRKNATKYAEEVSWENEAKKLVASYGNILDEQ